VSRHRDRELGRRLQSLRAPEEDAAEERSWEVVRAAFEERPALRPGRRPVLRLALASLGGAAIVAVGLSPAGAKVGDFVSDVVGVSDEQAQPALRSLPAAGEVLVESGDGAWIVRDDGSKRLLGDYDEASWSPYANYVAAASGARLVALDPSGEVQWELPTAGPPRQIAWEGSEIHTRIAFRANGDLYVAPGDGSPEHQVASDIQAGPLWIEFPGVTKVTPDPAVSFPYVLAYLDSGGKLQVVEADTGASIEVFGALRKRALGELRSDAVRSPTGNERAHVAHEDGRSTLSLVEGGERRVLYSGLGRFTQPTWSPDGRWLLFGWREADQWVFIQADHPQRVPIAISQISEEFDPGPGGGASFPRVSGWVLPDR
jgi:hypothetical protein